MSFAEYGLNHHGLIIMGSVTLLLYLHLPSRLVALYNFIFMYPDEIGHRVGTKELTRHKIEENVGTAAAVLCNLSSRKGYGPGRCFKDEVVGIVALLGTVANRELSR